MWMFLLRGLLLSVAFPSASPVSKWRTDVVTLGSSEWMPRFRNCLWFRLRRQQKRRTLRFRIIDFRYVCTAGKKPIVGLCLRAKDLAIKGLTPVAEDGALKLCLPPQHCWHSRRGLLPQPWAQQANMLPTKLPRPVILRSPRKEETLSWRGL